MNFVESSRLVVLSRLVEDGIKDVDLIESGFDQLLNEFDRLWHCCVLKLIAEAADESVVGLMVLPALAHKDAKQAIDRIHRQVSVLEQRDVVLGGVQQNLHTHWTRLRSRVLDATGLESLFNGSDLLRLWNHIVKECTQGLSDQLLVLANDSSRHATELQHDADLVACFVETSSASSLQSNQRLLEVVSDLLMRNRQGADSCLASHTIYQVGHHGLRDILQR